MSTPIKIHFAPLETSDLKAVTGRIAVLMAPDGKLGAAARKVNAATRKALTRLAESPQWEKAKEGEVTTLSFPAGLAAEALLVVKLSKRSDQETARRAGAGLARAMGKVPLTVFAGRTKRVGDIAFGLALKSYRFDAHKTGDKDPRPGAEFRVADPEARAAEASTHAALAEGVFFARDLVSEPANVLTTSDFAARLAAMEELGLEVDILEEPELEKLGMRLLLSVGQGSVAPSKVVVMRWQGGGDEAPLALVGKGVVFDTGGISLKGAAGMEEMTGDMGGAATVAGTMRALALRKARANVVGLVGLVENMPSGSATRPGDIVASMKGDTVEIINTDAEGRLVLADVLWYAQERFKPSGIIDLATLTGAMLVALGHDRAGVFSNDDAFADAFLKAAEAEGEGAWRMPMGDCYDKLIKSDKADMKNVGGRWAGSITAAQFLGRFIKDGQPWIHLDIAGTAMPASETDLGPKGASGWGVLALSRLVADREG